MLCSHRACARDVRTAVHTFSVSFSSDLGLCGKDWMVLDNDLMPFKSQYYVTHCAFLSTAILSRYSQPRVHTKAEETAV